MRLVKLIKAGVNYCKSSKYRFLINAGFGKYNSMPDEEYLIRKYEALMGKSLDLHTPQTFNEKLQWLKLYDRKPKYTMMVDKYLVRDYIADKLGSEYLIPLLGVWDNPEDIDFESLPNQFVLKCNHNSGTGMCICKDKSKLEIAKVKAELRKGLAQDYYLTGREWPYKDVPRKIIAEQYMKDSSTAELRDYKIYCFNGEPKYIQVISDRSTHETIDFFDMNWNHQCFTGLALPYKPFSGSSISVPKNLAKMKIFAQKLSEEIPFVRIDFYEINEKLYFGEITFYPASGFGEFSPCEWNEKLGRMISLPNGK